MQTCTALICNLLQGFRQYPHAWRLRPLWMTRRSCRILSITYPRVFNNIKCCQGIQSPFQGRFLQPSSGSRTIQRLTPLTAYGGSYDYAWTSNLNGAQRNINETFSYGGHHSPRPTSPAIQSGETILTAVFVAPTHSDGLDPRPV